MVKQAEQESEKKRWGQYLLFGIGILLSVLLVIGIFFFWDEIQHAKGYGYLTGFIVSVFGGITIIPVPSLLVVFTLGSKVNPAYLGLISGFGEALGGITVYLTGAGGGALWSKFRSRRHTFYSQASSTSANQTPTQPKPSSRWYRFYERLTNSIGHRGGYWALFITSAFVWWIYYPTALAAGTFHLGLKRFFLISWVGKTIRGLIVAFAGYWGLHVLLQWIGG